MSGDKRLIAPFALLVAANEPAPVGRVRLDDPKFRVPAGDVLIRIRTPLFVRPADEIDAQFRQDVRSVMQRLREILDAAPNEKMQRSRIIPPGTGDNPLRSLGGFAKPGVGSTFCLALPGDGPQVVGRRVSIGMRPELREVALIEIDHLQDVLLAAGSEWRRHETLDIEHIGIEEQVDHRLEIIGIRAANVAGNDDPVPQRRWLGGGGSVNGEQATDRDCESKHHDFPGLNLAIRSRHQGEPAGSAVSRRKRREAGESGRKTSICSWLALNGVAVIATPSTPCASGSQARISADSSTARSNAEDVSTCRRKRNRQPESAASTGRMEVLATRGLPPRMNSIAFSMLSESGSAVGEPVVAGSSPFNMMNAS